MIDISILWIRSLRWGLKLMSYIQSKYPEKERIYGCRKGSFYDSLQFAIALYRKDDTNDPEFVQLRQKTKNATSWALIAPLPFVLFFVGLLLLAVLFS
jgi:hypothetical protein